MCNKIQRTPFLEVLCWFEMKNLNYYEIILREAQLQVLLRFTLLLYTELHLKVVRSSYCFI